MRSAEIGQWLRSIGAVALGAGAVVCLFSVLAPHVWGALGIGDRVGAPGALVFSAWRLFEGLVFLSGGALAAIIAARHRVRHALVVALLVDAAAFMTLRPPSASDNGRLVDVGVSVAAAALGGVLGSGVAYRLPKPRSRA